MTGPRDIQPLPPDCPWGGWTPPDLQHCEANLCGWITTPANTWSNLAYVAVGVWIWRRAAKRDLLAAGGLGPVSIAVGVTSFAFHASYTFAGQVLDYGGMFLLIGWALARGALDDFMGAAAHQVCAEKSADAAGPHHSDLHDKILLNCTIDCIFPTRQWSRAPRSMLSAGGFGSSKSGAKG